MTGGHRHANGRVCYLYGCVEGQTVPVECPACRQALGHVPQGGLAESSGTFDKVKSHRPNCPAYAASEVAVIAIKRGTARRLGLRTPYNAIPGLIVRIPELTPEQFEEFEARFVEELRHGRTRFVYPPQTVQVEQVSRRHT